LEKQTPYSRNTGSRRPAIAKRGGFWELRVRGGKEKMCFFGGGGGGGGGVCGVFVWGGFGVFWGGVGCGGGVFDRKTLS